MLNANVTMHAQWRENTQPPPTQYTITFESHGGSAVTAITADAGTAVNKPTDPTRGGYTFTNWFSTVTGGTAYSWPHTLNANVTMHAQWTPITYIVVYNANGGGGTMESSSHTYDQAQALTTNGFTRTGYTFSGWNTHPNSNGTSYPNGASATNLSSTNGDTVTLYAQWTLNSYTITYQLNGGTNGANPATYTIENADITLATATREGYTFVGWYEDSELAGRAVTGILQGSTGDKTFYAKWTLNSYTITYQLNGGTNGANPAAYTIESADITLAVATREGYTFRGWYEDSGFAGAPVTSISSGTTGNKIFYAKWAQSAPVNVSVWVNEDDGDILVSDNNITISRSGAGGNPVSFTVTVESAYTGVQWYLQGYPIPGRRGAVQSITFNAADTSYGTYILGVTVTKNGIPYSTDIRFTVTN
jgi:uncharacterized repeat protein (TIGR02543 family)